VIKAFSHFWHLCSGEEGATVVEYVLMLALIAMVCLAGVAAIGNIDALFFDVGNTL